MGNSQLTASLTRSPCTTPLLCAAPPNLGLHHATASAPAAALQEGWHFEWQHTPAAAAAVPGGHLLVALGLPQLANIASQSATITVLCDYSRVSAIRATPVTVFAPTWPSEEMPTVLLKAPLP